MKTVFFDLETGGPLDTHPDIQLAAIAVDDQTWEELGTFERKLRFDEAAAQPEALKMNHYDRVVWANDALAPKTACEEFSRFIGPFCCLEMEGKIGPYSVCRLAGHNAATFDGPRLKRLFQSHGLFLAADPRIRCTVQRALWYFDETGLIPPPNYRLETLCRYFQIPWDGSHEVLADVRMTIALARALKGDANGSR